MIGIINYGSGNIQAIANIYNRNNTPFEIINEPGQIKKADNLILPGVGAYDATGGGASGGSGLVIIKYALKVYTTGNSNTINTPSDNANHRYAYFTNSGTFTTINSLTCDILIVGGGGSGGEEVKEMMEEEVVVVVKR